jgi:glyoxalase family protein
MSESVSGIHHITCIAGDPQENLDFYAGVLGMRLVKRSVNQDAPGTYHFFFADAKGNPGTDLTFFPWPGMGPGIEGTGKASEISLAVPRGSLDYWAERLAAHGTTVGTAHFRRQWRALPLADPHGLPLALVEAEERQEFAPWSRSGVPADRQVRGLHSIRMDVFNLGPTAAFLTETFGFTPLGVEEGWHGFGLGDGGSGRFIEIRETPEAPRGEWGVGSMHHIAWRAADDATELAVRRQVAAAGRRPTEVIDRFWFKSVYFQEPGGVLFEIATDGPGFATDEDPNALGESLVLPPWLEPHRREIEAALPPITSPHPAADA